MESHPLLKPSGSFDLAGVTSLLGGDDAVSAMTAVHIYGNRSLLGWYNTPGSFQVAKRLNTLGKTPLLNTLSNGHVDFDLSTLLGLELGKSPKFRGAHSGTIMEETGYLAALFIHECATHNSKEIVIPGRRTKQVGITIADLYPAPPYEMYTPRSSPFAFLTAGIPIIVSLAACVICGVWGEWYAMSLICIGIFASGMAGCVLGTAKFVFTHPKPAKGSPRGDGILRSDATIVLIRGEEAAVNSITRGNFCLRFLNTVHYRAIRGCALLFFIQGVAQLLYIPRASWYGQVIFLASVGVSALYNAWLSSLDREEIHRRMFFGKILRNPTLTKFTLGTRTTAVVFTLLVLELEEPEDLLRELLPNDTKVWREWRRTILEWLRKPNDSSFGGKISELDGFTQEEKDLLGLLLDDARSAYKGYEDYLQVRKRDTEPRDA